MAETNAPVAGQPGYDPTARPQSINMQEPEIERGIVESNKTMSLFHYRDLPMDSTTLDLARYVHQVD
jgi:hypothetical protein